MDAMTNDEGLMKYSGAVARVVEQMLINGDRTTVRQAAIDAHMSKGTYSFIRKLLVLKSHDRINPTEKTVISTALGLVDTGKLGAAQALVNGILRKHWVNGTHDGIGVIRAKGQRNYSSTYYHNVEKPKIKRQRKMAKNMKRFDRTLFAIREACTNNDELIIPDLTPEAQREAIDVLLEAMGGLFDLRRKIADGGNNEGP